MAIKKDTTNTGKKVGARKKTTTPGQKKTSPTRKRTTRKKVITDENNPLIPKEVDTVIDKMASPPATEAVKKEETPPTPIAQPQPKVVQLTPDNTKSDPNLDAALAQKSAEELKGIAAKNVTATKAEAITTNAQVIKNRVSIERELGNSSDAELREKARLRDAELERTARLQREGEMAIATLGRRMLNGVKEEKAKLEEFIKSYTKVWKKNRNQSTRSNKQNIILVAVVVDSEEYPLTDRTDKGFYAADGRVQRVVPADEQLLKDLIRPELEKRIGLEGWKMFSYSSLDGLEVFNTAGQLTMLDRFMKHLISSKKKIFGEIGNKIRKTYALK